MINTENKINSLKNIPEEQRKIALDMIKQINEKYSNIPTSTISVSTKNIVIIYKYENLSEEKNKTLTIEVLSDGMININIFDELKCKIILSEKIQDIDLNKIFQAFKG